MFILQNDGTGQIKSICLTGKLLGENFAEKYLTLTTKFLILFHEGLHPNSFCGTRTEEERRLCGYYLQYSYAIDTREFSSHQARHGDDPSWLKLDHVHKRTYMSVLCLSLHVLFLWISLWIHYWTSQDIHCYHNLPLWLWLHSGDGFYLHRQCIPVFISEPVTIPCCRKDRIFTCFFYVFCLSHYLLLSSHNTACVVNVFYSTLPLVLHKRWSMANTHVWRDRVNRVIWFSAALVFAFGHPSCSCSFQYFVCIFGAKGTKHAGDWLPSSS